jgi:hypothetical protein
MEVLLPIRKPLVEDVALPIFNILVRDEALRHDLRLASVEVRRMGVLAAQAVNWASKASGFRTSVDDEQVVGGAFTTC